MKRLTMMVLGGLLLTAFTLFSSLDDVVGALKTGNTDQITKYFDNTVEITMPDKSNTYSKSQAELVLRDFFSANPVKGFEVQHRGENNGSKYCVGTLATKAGSYRTTVFMKQKGDKLVLQELRFENN